MPEWIIPLLLTNAGAIYYAIRKRKWGKLAEIASQEAYKRLPPEAQEAVARVVLERARIKFEKAEKWAPQLGWSRPLPSNFTKVERIK